MVNDEKKILEELKFLFPLILAAALTEFSPERKKKQQHEPSPRKQDGKKKQTKVTKKMLRTRPAKYHFLIPPNTPEAARIELEQRQRPVSIIHIELLRKKEE